MRTSLIPSRCLKPLGVFALIALAIGLTPGTASAQTCIQDEFDAFNGVSKTLSCTANDVSVAAVQNSSINIFQGGLGDKCLAGGKFSFTALFDIKTTSSKTRSNIGIFFGTGQPNALVGTCTQAILAPHHPCAFVNGSPTAMCGSDEYEELDGAINGETTTNTKAGCGDTTSGDTSPTFGVGTQQATLEVDNVTCPTSGTSVSLPVCTGWYQPTSTMPVCESPAPDYPWQPQAVPGTTSKCSCSTLTIPVQPITPSVSVAKSCNTTASTGTGLTSCDEGAGDVSSNTVTYHVAITNSTPAGEGGVIIDQICDSLYGTIFKSASFTGTACPAGSLGSIISTTCSSTVPGDIANGGSGTCDFTVHQAENLKETDTVTVSGHSDLQTTATFGPTSSNSVTVTSEDSPSTSSTTKGLAATEAACATIRYNVSVANTSAQDETIFLSALNDSIYADITTVHGNVLGTTCGVASGLGTLSSSPGAGTLPKSIAPGSSYQCQFDGQFCGPILTAAEQFGTGVCSSGTCTNQGAPVTACMRNTDCDATCKGITQTDTVTGTIAGDEGETVSQTITGLNVTECVASFTSSH